MKTYHSFAELAKIKKASKVKRTIIVKSSYIDRVIAFRTMRYMIGNKTDASITVNNRTFFSLYRKAKMQGILFDDVKVV